MMMKKIILLFIFAISFGLLGELATAQSKSSTVFERALDSLESVKFINSYDYGSHRNTSLKLDSLEAVRLTFPHIMLNRILFITLKPTVAFSSELWVDLNNNDIREPNEIIYSSDKMLAIKINKNVMTFYGKIDSLKIHSFASLPRKVKQLLIRGDQERSVCDRINTINISRSTQLKHLDINGSNLEKIIFGNNEELRSLNLDNNRLQLLKVIALNNLEHISCRNNQIKLIDLSKCDKLHTINCSNNQLKQLKLEQLSMLTNLVYSNNLLDNLDLSKFPALTKLNCSNNGIKSLELTNSKLTHLNCSENQLYSLDLSKTNELKSLSCNKNMLNKITFPSKSKLENINCYDNNLTSIELSSLDKLKNIDCSKNKLLQIDITRNNNLENLKANANKLQSIKIDKSNKLANMNLAFNDFTELPLDNCSILKSLDCSNNHISSINISNCAQLEELNVSHNALSALNVNIESKIKSLSCYSNSITADNIAILLANLSATSQSDTFDIYLLNNNPIKERNDISASEDIIKKMSNWRFFYVEVDNDTLINVNTQEYPHFDNVYLINLSSAKHRSNSMKLKINGVAPPYNVAITDENMNIITQYESGASFVDIKTLRNGIYNIRVAKEGKVNFYNFIKN